MIGKSSQDGLRHPVLLNVSFATSLVARVSNVFLQLFLAASLENQKRLCR